MATRVPFAFAVTTSSQCHKYDLVAQFQSLPIFSSSLRPPESSSDLSITHFISPSTSLLSSATKRSQKALRRCSIRNMADSSLRTVLVTGAGGRTGSIFSLFVQRGFLWFHVFWVKRRRSEIGVVKGL